MRGQRNPLNMPYTYWSEEIPLCSDKENPEVLSAWHKVYMRHIGTAHTELTALIEWSLSQLEGRPLCTCPSCEEQSCKVYAALWDLIHSVPSVERPLWLERLTEALW